MDVIDQIRQIYFNATPKTIQRDLARAVDLLKTLPDEEARERAAVFMDGLAQMRSEWALESRKAGAAPARKRE
jgi:hypothetical protein